MRVVVNDACLLIDLIDIDLPGAFLKLNLQAHISLSVLAELDDDIYRQKVDQCIQESKITVHIFDFGEQYEVEKLMQTHSARLSKPDVSCLYLSFKLKATLLTCESLLRKTASGLGVEVHGSLWVLDQLVDTATITKQTASHKLKELNAINPRLPVNEVRRRLKNWK